MTAILAGWILITCLNIALLPRNYAPRVEVEILMPASLPLMVRAAGNLEAKDSDTFRSQFDGPVMSKQFQEGQKVRKGQLLAVLGADRIRGDYQSKKDALINAKSDLDHAKRDLRMQKKLYKQEAVAYSTVDDAQRALVKAEQALRSAQDAMKVAQAQWNSSEVRAPIDGTVVKDGIGEDKFVTSGKDLVTVADVSEFTLHAKVDELDIRQVHEGQHATVKIEAFPNMPVGATVTQVGSQIEGTGLPEIPIVLKLSETAGLDLRPKLTAEARIFTGSTEPILAIPLTAIVNNDGVPHVWVLSSWNRLRQRTVSMGRTNPEYVEITRGLSRNERVVMTAEPDFADGMHALIGDPETSPGGISRTAKFLPPPKPKDASNPWQTPKKKS
jgi:RND family efflux transporter MFP subunit